MKTPAAALALLLGLATASWAAERHMMRAPIPEDRRAEARALVNPLTATPETVEKGRTIYEGKGMCANCHGIKGHGDGPAAASLDPSPRNFHHRGFWRHRTEGEIFWAIKHGSSSTAMTAFGGHLTDEDIWLVVRYLETFAGGRRSPMHGRGRGGEPCCPTR